MEWIQVKDKKPEQDQVCYVCNIRRGVHCFIAIYKKYHDVFIWYNPQMMNQPPIDVTHWIPLPGIPYE